MRGIGDKTCWTKPLRWNLLLGMGIVKGKGMTGIEQVYGLQA